MITTINDTVSTF